MGRVLFMTVGTGVGTSEDKIYSLAHGLMKSIKHSRPDKIVYFGSELSKKTVNSIEEQYKIEGIGDLPKDELVIIDDVDEFRECFSKIQKKILEYDGFEIIIDYTSGTKTMTTSAAICSLLYHKDLTVVYGDREKNGMVNMGTEQVKTQNLYLAYDELLFDEFKKFFNVFRFQTAADILQKIVSRKDKAAYMELTKAYHAWDLFNHAHAKEIITSPLIRQLEEIKDGFSRNMEVLGPLASQNQQNKSPQLIADLINNAKRRGAEQKYDDAVARLYRTVELIAQCILREKHGIDTSDIKIDRLNTLAKSQMQFKKGSTGKVTCGLHQSYQLLRIYDEEIGKRFSEDKELKNLLKKRNYSILAHGLNSIEKKEYEKLLDKTVEFAIEAYPPVEPLMDKAEFPRL